MLGRLWRSEYFSLVSGVLSRFLTFRIVEHVLKRATVAKLFVNAFYQPSSYGFLQIILVVRYSLVRRKR